MTTSDETGFLIYFLHDGMTVHQGEGLRVDGRVMRRGDRLLVTPALRAANSGRDGQCALDLEASAQVRRFGKVMWELGEPPADFDPLVPGSFEHDQARTNAIKEAAEIADPDEQRIALAKVRERFGTASENRSKTLRSYSGRQ